MRRDVVLRARRRDVFAPLIPPPLPHLNLVGLGVAEEVPVLADENTFTKFFSSPTSTRRCRKPDHR